MQSYMNTYKLHKHNFEQKKPDTENMQSIMASMERSCD